MTEEEAHKINDLYKQIDTLTAENVDLKSAKINRLHSVILDRLDDLEALIKSPVSKSVSKK
tara:strand:+ start:912 stop:1094 length:183 start_codon:yes stop_codon:yes gene_type:complete